MKTMRLTATLMSLMIIGGFATNALADTADVIVYGSTPGGFCAAIAAAREGASVILLEPTSHVGGMNTGGLSFSDSNQTYRNTLMGLFDEWHTRIQQDYTDRGINLPYDVSVKDQTRWSYEPHVASRVTGQMLSEAGVQVLTERHLSSVNKTGARITSLGTTNGTYSARTFVDGSYEGDLMAASGVSWTIGREGTADFRESLAGKRYPKGQMNINGFDAGGTPLPLITTTDAGPTSAGDGNIMTYSFRMSLTTSAANKVPMPAPANYDPARFEVIRRYVQAGGSSVGFDTYAVPNGKVDGNNSIGRQFSLGLVGGGLGWAEADQAGRAAIFEEYKQYTLEFIHFLSTDSVFSASQRANVAKWGLCADEFPDTGHFPPQLYVRESRRMQGEYVVSQNDIIDNPAKDDPIVVSSFPIDSHDVQRVALEGGGVINEGTIYPVRQNGRGYPYHIPYGAIVPVEAEADNLLVPVALSCTHVAISSIRVEPTWMVLGQSAGIAAALAADQDVAVQDLLYADLEPRLLAQGQVLDLPPGFGPPDPPDPLDGIGAHNSVYIRSGHDNPAYPNTNWNADTDNEVIVGPTIGDVLRGLIEFDVSEIPASDKIDSVSQVLTTLNATPGIGGINTFSAYAYGFDFDETTATWNAPGSGDTTAGGTFGTLLSSVTFDTTQQDLTVTFDDTPEFRAALADALAGDGFLRLILANDDETVGAHNFARFADGTPFTSENRLPELLVLHSPDPATMGDTNEDGIIDDIDLANFEAEFGQIDAGLLADFDDDGDTDLDDFVTLRQYFGTNFNLPAAPASAEFSQTPEPATLTLLAMGGLAILRMRRRRT